MQKFNIEIISKKPIIINGNKEYKGQITIGDFQENFYMSIDNWSVPDYKKQWKEGIERIKTHDSSCLVVNFAGSIENPWIELWTLYREGETIFIHNQYLFYEVFQERSQGLPSFDSKSCYLYIALPRQTVSESGRKISEWQTTIHDLPLL